MRTVVDHTETVLLIGDNGDFRNGLGRAGIRGIAAVVNAHAIDNQSIRDRRSKGATVARCAEKVSDNNVGSVVPDKDC